MNVLLCTKVDTGTPMFLVQKYGSLVETKRYGRVNSGTVQLLTAALGVQNAWWKLEVELLCVDHDMRNVAT